MQVAAHRPEEALGALEALELGGGEQPGPDEVGGPLDAVDIFADPVERVEVAQAALAVLDVGFDDVAAVAHPDVALVALGELGGDEFGGGAGDDLLAEALASRRRTTSRRPTATAPRGRRCGPSCRFLASAISCAVERSEWPTFSFRSHSRWSMASATRSCFGVGGLAVRNIEVDVAERRHLAAAGAAERRRAPDGSIGSARRSATKS